MTATARLATNARVATSRSREINQVNAQVELRAATREINQVSARVELRAAKRDRTDNRRSRSGAGFLPRSSFSQTKISLRAVDLVRRGRIGAPKFFNSSFALTAPSHLRFITS